VCRRGAEQEREVEEFWNMVIPAGAAHGAFERREREIYSERSVCPRLPPVSRYIKVKHFSAYFPHEMELIFAISSPAGLWPVVLLAEYLIVL
jgi:hypothetical protein